MNAAQLRSLPVQAGLTAALFLGSLVLAGLIVSQRWRFESFVKENYSLPGKELSEATHSVIKSLSQGEAAAADWPKIPDAERRAVYLSLMQHNDFPTAQSVAVCLETNADFFVMCAERTVVCGDKEQRARGLRFLELCGGNRCGQVLNRLASWADRSGRIEDLTMIDQTRHRMKSNSAL